MARVVVIEDEPILLEDILEVLRLEGHHAEGAPNGTLGLRLIIEMKPDVILCDKVMAGIDGMTVLEELRKNPETADIPFIFLTARVDQVDMEKALNSGASDYIRKPFEFPRLLAAINSLANRQNSGG